MKNLQTYSDFIVESVSTEPVNEGLFDMLKGLFSKVADMFDDADLLSKKLEQAAIKAGAADNKVTPKSIKVGSTTLLKLVDPQDENNKSILSLTKLADMPDGSGLFQITGSDNANFLKSFNVKSVTELNLVGVMAIIGPEGFVNDKSLTMRVYKNVSKTGKPTVTDSVIKAALNADNVAKEKPEA